MDKAKIEKIFSPITLFIINIAIIIVAEITGQLFFQFGIIHIIAVLFVILSIIRIFVRYYSYDPILEKFFLASLGALFVLALSHIVEYFSMNMGVFVGYTDSVLANTVNFYLISLVLIIIGAEAFLRINDSRSRSIVNLLIGLIVSLATLVFVFTAYKGLVSLEPDNPIPYVYMTLVSYFGLIALKKINRIGKIVSISRGFIRYITASIILIMLSTVPYIFYDLMLTRFSIPLFQAMYLSHFFFYVSLSLFFLAFGRVKIAGGVYEDLKKI